MCSERLQPLYLDPTSLPLLPSRWVWLNVDDATAPVSVGRKYDRKMIISDGAVPVIDQSISGIMGYHNHDAGVKASLLDPVFTFANHTCAMRWMTSHFSCIQNVFAFRGRSGIDTRYIFYATQGRVVLEEYKGHVPTFRSMFIPIPPLPVQREIAAIFGALDDRITLLRETNTTLESIAQAIFKSWFVDFDPVRAKQAGRMPEGMNEATAALFPDGFEESELGWVPRGWRYSTVGQLFVLTMGQSPPGNTYNEVGSGLPFYQGRTDFGFRFPSQRVFCAAPTRLAAPGDTLVSVRAPVGDVNMALEKCCLGRGVAGVRHPKGYRSFTFYATRRLRSRFDLFNSEGTVFGSINKKDFQGLLVIEPLDTALAAFDHVAAPIDQRIVENEGQIRTLAALRDTLLPRLISGQLRLKEVESIAEDALT